MGRLRMARRFVRGGMGRLALTVLAVAGGVALVCAVRLANQAVLRAFVEVVETMAGRAALEVVAGERGLFPESVAAALGGVPGIEVAAPSVKAAAFTTDGSGELLTVYGVDLTDEAGERVYGVRLEVDDPLVFLARADSLALGRPFALAHGIGPGDRIELSTPAGRRGFTVRGLLDAEGVARAYGGNVAVMDVQAAEAIFTRPGFVTGVDIVLRPDADVRQVAEAIARQLPDGLRVESPAQRQADLRRVTESLGLTLQALGLFGLVAAFLITFNRLSTVYEERTWQLGVLRAVGVRTGALWRELLAESLLVGAAGVALGLPLGIGLGRLLLPVIATTSALALKLIVPEGRPAAEWPTLALAGAFGLGTAVLAAALPAWRAAGGALAETMGSRGQERPGTGGRAAWAVRGAVLGAIALALGVQAAHPGLLGTALAALATALAARPAVHAAGFLLAAGSRRFAGPAGRLAAASLLHNPRRTALTVATLGVGLGCVVWFWTMAQSFRDSLVTVLTVAVRADLVVSSTHVTNGYVEAPLGEEVVTRLTAQPGVAAAIGSRVIDWPHAGRRVAIEALDARYFASAEFGRWPLAAERIPAVWERGARGEAAVVSANFLSNFGARVGAPLVLDTPSGPLELVIGGVTAAFESPDGTIQMSRELVRRYWRDTQVNRVGLRVAPGVAVATVRAAIARDLGRAYDLRILSAGELVGYYATQVRRAFAPLRVLAVTVLLVTLLGVADTLLAGVLARTRELGMVRAVGARRALVARTVLGEALLLGALGVALGLASGVGLAVLWVMETLPRLLGWVLELHLPLREAPLLALLTVAVVALAAVLPARRAVRLDPALALRQE